MEEKHNEEHHSKHKDETHHSKHKDETHHSKKDEGGSITISKVNLWQIVSGVFALLFVISLFTGGLGMSTNSVSDNVRVEADNPPSQPSQPSVATGAAKVSAADLADDDAVLGDANAPITIVEFSDYQCPFCRKFWSESFHQIKEEYIDTGIVKFVYRDFPLTSIHPMAAPSAEALECIRDEGGDEAYYEFHDKIFEEQNILDGGDALTGPVRSTVSYTNDDLVVWAAELNYDIEGCLSSEKYQDEVAKDLQDGVDNGVRGTPYFVVGEIPLSGAQPFSAFKQAIDAQL